MIKEKTTETCLVLSTGFILLYLIFRLEVFLIASFVIGIIGVFIKPLANPITWFWLKLGEMMGFVISKVILTIVFFIFLLPIATLYRIVKKDTLDLKNSKVSMWKDQNRKFATKDLENIW
jgi:hypothetical protein